MAEHEGTELAQFGAELAALRKLLSEFYASNQPFAHGERTERERTQDSPERIDWVARGNETLLPEASEPIWQGRFDADWYLKQYPDVAREGWDPLQHFIQHGLREGRQPNPRAMWEREFDAGWYLRSYPDVARTGVDPFEHFIEHGLKEGRAPNRGGTDWTAAFDPVWYLDQYPDVARAGLDPLDHFLNYGLKEGRQPCARRPITGTSTPVTAAEIYCLKRPSLAGEIALMVSYAPFGSLRPHTIHYIKSLRRHEVSVVVIAAADRPFTASSGLVDEVDGLFVRQNGGLDFAAWAHVLLLHPELFDARILYLVNDSVFGPTNSASFGELLRRVRDSTADFVGLTEDYDRGWHLQSYFFAFKQRAIASVAFQKFIQSVVSFAEKEDILNQYEVQLSRLLKEKGLQSEVLFPAPGRYNPTLFHWKDLLHAGFPFLKVQTVRDTFLDVDISGWRELLTAQGYDVSLVDETLTEAGRSALSVSASSTTEFRSFLPAAKPRMPPDTKIAFIGPWNYDNGLGFAGRGYISALRRLGLQVNLYPIRKPFHIHQQVAPAVDICDFSGDPDIAVVHINPDGWPGILSEGVFTEAQIALIERARIRVCAAVWEITRLPPYWSSVFERVDAIWAPSRHCAEIFRTAASVPVDVIPYVVSTPAIGASEGQGVKLRATLGLSERKRFILYAFDGSSFLARKNPFALIRAFERTGLAQRDWQLVLKTKYSFDVPAQGHLLQREASRVEGVVQFDKPLNIDAMHQLISTADIYASPHTAEGFGLTIAEAMAAGKVVVATDYSGS